MGPGARIGVVASILTAEALGVAGCDAQLPYTEDPTSTPPTTPPLARHTHTPMPSQTPWPTRTPDNTPALLTMTPTVAETPAVPTATPVLPIATREQTASPYPEPPARQPTATERPRQTATPTPTAAAAEAEAPPTPTPEQSAIPLEIRTIFDAEFGPGNWTPAPFSSFHWTAVEIPTEGSGAYVNTGQGTIHFARVNREVEGGRLMMIPNLEAAKAAALDIVTREPTHDTAMVWPHGAGEFKIEYILGNTTYTYGGEVTPDPKLMHRFTGTCVVTQDGIEVSTEKVDTCAAFALMFYSVNPDTDEFTVLGQLPIVRMAAAARPDVWMRLDTATTSTSKKVPGLTPDEWEEKCNFTTPVKPQTDIFARQKAEFRRLAKSRTSRPRRGFKDRA